MRAASATYDAVGRFFAAAVGNGVRHVVVSPGSRSTALALCAEETAGLRTWIRIDERAAAFFALGLARAGGAPAFLVCTSGTAAANYLPAVVEAHFAGVPLVVLTADRPPELRDWGAGQTIDQSRLYGRHVRWFAEAPIAAELSPEFAARWWPRFAARAVAHSVGADPGPVHIDWPLREPLEPPPDWPAAPSALAGAVPSPADDGTPAPP
ncbi:MAG TPA: 2-succinyl-5-enolpyruvyl-6-hydroxy-3-cyclohexene-1-carboxylic-acid synthase, partial [Acidimicrobiaceae bacterium]|nr:2-succinyl-5-enolpyruvyl-6-hydroxy-3-cyclohexene-1-carboxylic-acid synthase [Acidimicrobiaceae bacterium]